MSNVSAQTQRVTERQFVRCRTYGHAWSETMDSTWAPDAGYPLTLLCVRCETERRDAVDHASGELLTRRYVYKAGYQYARGDGVPTRSDFRVMLVGALMADARSRRAKASR